MKYMVLAVKGMAYGLTHIAPGLGGALVLIIMGIYEEFVEAIGNLFVKRDRWREYLSFLVPVGVGMVIGMVALAKGITFVLDRYPAATMFFFMGLLVGTIPSVIRMHNDMRPSVGRVAAFVVGIVLVVIVRLLEPDHGAGLTLASINAGSGILLNLLVSFLAGGASVTPGLDGSYILLLGGTYEPVLEAVSALAHFVIHWGALASTGIGAVVGIIIFSKVIDTVINRVPSVAYYCVLGLVIGSVYGLWPREPAQVGWVVLLLAFAAGCGIAWALASSQSELEAELDVATE